MIDTLYIAKQIPYSVVVQDTINFNSIVGGDLGLNVSDSLNLVLSGTPSVSVIMPQQVNWEAIIIGVIGIVVNAIIVYLTFRSKKQLQKLETKEIRVRKIQDIAIGKQSELYKLLVDLSDESVIIPEKETSFKLSEYPNSNLIRKINYTRNYIEQNKLHINDKLEAIARSIIDLYDPSLNKDISFNDMNNIEGKLKEYTDSFNSIL